jgi:hypothetical protein
MLHVLAQASGVICSSPWCDEEVHARVICKTCHGLANFGKPLPRNHQPSQMNFVGDSPFAGYIDVDFSVIHHLQQPPQEGVVLHNPREIKAAGSAGGAKQKIAWQ